jgi:hypothetical protein
MCLLQVLHKSRIRTYNLYKNTDLNREFSKQLYRATLIQLEFLTSRHAGCQECQFLRLIYCENMYRRVA